MQPDQFVICPCCKAQLAFGYNSAHSTIIISHGGIYGHDDKNCNYKWVNEMFEQCLSEDGKLRFDYKTPKHEMQSRIDHAYKEFVMDEF